MNSNSPWRQRLVTLGALLGGALFMWQAYQAADALRETGFSVLHPEWIFAALCGIVIVTGLQISAWRAIMQNLGVHLSWSAAIRGYMLPFVSRYIPGMVWGYLSRTHWMMERHQVAARTVNVGAVIEVLGFLISAALFVGVSGLLGQVGLIASIGLASALVIMIGVVLAGHSSPRVGFADKLWRILKVDGWIREITIQRIAVAWPWHFGMWLGHGFIVGCLLRAISGWSGEFLPIIVASFPLAWLGGFVVVVLPAGLGLREYGLVYLLATYAGIAQPEASTVAVMSRVSVLLGELSFLLIALALERHTASKRSHTLRDQDV